MLTAELTLLLLLLLRVCGCSCPDKDALLQVAVIGQGSFGSVIKATQLGPMGEPMGDVAIKLLPRGDPVRASSSFLPLPLQQSH